METGLAGKSVLVTGASGGIGAACARAFAAEGARLGVHYHQGRERAEAVAADLDDAVVLQADLTDEAEVDRFFRRRAKVWVALTSAPPSPALGPRRMCRSGSCR